MIVVFLFFVPMAVSCYLAYESLRMSRGTYDALCNVHTSLMEHDQEMGEVLDEIYDLIDELVEEEDPDPDTPNEFDDEDLEEPEQLVVVGLEWPQK